MTLSRGIKPNINQSPEIVNLRNSPKSLKEYGTIYIGRSDKNPHHFGNPFSHIQTKHKAIKVQTRQQSVECFEKWLIGTDFKHIEQDRRHWILKHLWKIKQAKKLACFCHPKACHGDILKKLALETRPNIH